MNDRSNEQWETNERFREIMKLVQRGSHIQCERLAESKADDEWLAIEVFQ